MLPTLADAFLGALRCDPVPVDRAALNDALAEIIEQVQETYPALQVPAAEFCVYLGERLDSDPSRDIVTRLQSMAVSDLYLACGSILGLEPASAILVERFNHRAKIALHRLRIPVEMREEVSQILQERILVGHQGSSPRIASFAGRGDLDSWFQVAALRTAQRLMKKEEREVPVEDKLLLQACADGDNLELEYLKAHYQQAFKAAFQEAIQDLSHRERNLLRYQIIDRLSIDQIGAIYQVHRSTAARQIAAAKETLAHRTRIRLAEDLGASPTEARSLMKLIHSQLELSIHRCLAPDGEDPES